MKQASITVARRRYETNTEEVSAGGSRRHLLGVRAPEDAGAKMLFAIPIPAVRGEKRGFGTLIHTNNA